MSPVVREKGVMALWPIDILLNLNQWVSFSNVFLVKEQEKEYR